MLVNKYDGEYPVRWANEIFDYLSIKKDEFPTKIFMIILSRQSSIVSITNYYVIGSDPHIWKWNDLIKNGL